MRILIEVMYKIEILLATYNSERFVEQQLDSIFYQSFRDWHLTVQDGGSTDGTLQILERFKKKYNSKISILYNASHKLSSKENFSSILSKVDSPYYMFCDHDDVWFKDKIEKTFQFLKYSTTISDRELPLLVFTDSVVTNENLEVLSESFFTYQNLDPNKISLENLLLQNVAPGNTMLFNHALKKIATPIPNEAIMHDYWLMLIACIFGRIYFFDEPTISYRQHGQNVIGASKFSFLTTMRKLIKEPNKISLSLGNQYLQAQTIYNDFGSTMPMPYKKILEDFLKIKDQDFINKRLSIIKGHFFKHGVLRNLGLFLFV